MWLKQHPGRCGRKNLIRKIDLIACQHLASGFVPKKKLEIEEKKAALEKEVAELGTDLTSTARTPPS